MTQRYHRSPKRNILRVRSRVFVTCALQGHRRKYNSRFTKDAQPVCQINTLFPVRQRQLHQERKACHQKNLAVARSLILFWADNPRSHSIVRQVRNIDAEVLLHSTAIARPRTIRIIQTTYYSSVFASLRNLVSSSDRENRHNVTILN